MLIACTEQREGSVAVTQRNCRIYHVLRLRNLCRRNLAELTKCNIPTAGQFEIAGGVVLDASLFRTVTCVDSSLSHRGRKTAPSRRPTTCKTGRVYRGFQNM